MRSVSRVVFLAVVSMVLVACNDSQSSPEPSSGPSSEPPPAPASATLLVSPASVEMVAGSATAVRATVTNTSSSVTATAVSAALPSDWRDITEDASGCATLAPQASCILSFTPATTTHAATTVSISGTNATAISVSLQVSLPGSANISVDPAVLSLVAGGGSLGTIRVTNNSTVLAATGVTADLSGTLLANAIGVDASECASVAPGASCAITFTPGNTAVSATSFPIQGTNTNTVAGTIAVHLPASAMIRVTGSPLVLAGSYGTPAAGTLTVTNDSTVLTATNISATLVAPLTGAVTEDASDCVSVAPGANCTLTFTPGTNAAAATSVVIHGDNTSQAGASIAVNAATPTISISPTALTLYAAGTADTITVTNTGSQPALNIGATIAGTALAGKLTVTGNTCGSTLAAGASCTLSLTPGSAAAAATAINIAGGNTGTVSAQIGISVQIGQNYLGGIVFFINGDGASGKLASAADLTSLPWGGSGTATGATSFTSGTQNTATIIGMLGTGSSYAALECHDYTGGGATVGTWYLPSITELQSLLIVAYGNSAFGSLAGHYWSSYELGGTSAAIVDSVSQNFSSDAKVNAEPVRCARTF